MCYLCYLLIGYDKDFRLVNTIRCLSRTPSRNPDVFPDPFTYKTERWLVDEKARVTADSVTLTESGYCPFSIGVCWCPAKTLAYLEKSNTLAKLLLRLDGRLLEGDQTEAGGPELMWGRRNKPHYQVNDCFVTLRNGAMVRFRLRENHHGGDC